jgi:HK97 family phage prohead protease
MFKNEEVLFTKMNIAPIAEGGSARFLEAKTSLEKDVDFAPLVLDAEPSTDDLDRTKEVVLSSAFEQDLPEYMANPLVTFQHDIYLPIGKAVEANIEEHGLRFKDELLYLPGDALMDYIYAAVNQGVLRTMSIGFRPIEWEDNAGEGIRTYTRVKLIEHAIVSYPANPYATFQPLEEKSCMHDSGLKGLNRLSYATAMHASALNKDRVTATDKGLVEECSKTLIQAGIELKSLLEDNIKCPVCEDKKLDLLFSYTSRLKGEEELTEEMERHLEKHFTEFEVAHLIPWGQEDRVKAWENLFELVRLDADLKNTTREEEEKEENDIKEALIELGKRLDERKELFDE